MRSVASNAASARAYAADARNPTPCRPSQRRPRGQQRPRRRPAPRPGGDGQARQRRAVRRARRSSNRSRTAPRRPATSPRRPDPPGVREHDAEQARQVRRDRQGRTRLQAARIDPRARRSPGTRGSRVSASWRHRRAPVRIQTQCSQIDPSRQHSSSPGRRDHGVIAKAPGTTRDSPLALLLDLAHCESDGTRAPSCRALTRGHVVPTHRIHTVEPRGASGATNSTLGVSWSRASTRPGSRCSSLGESERVVAPLELSVVDSMKVGALSTAS
jgi:hypothetical protein